MRRAGHRFLVLCCLAAAVAAGCGRGPVVPEFWNLLVLVPDTVRADHLGINGYARPTTPHLDALARSGINFSQALSAAPRTWQAYSSILTGLYPPHHGVRFIHDRPLAPELPTLASELGRAGWATRAFDRIHFLGRMTGGHHFDGFHNGESNGDDGDRALVERVWQWLSLPREKPFFAFVRTHGPHWPYHALPERVARFDSCEGREHRFNRGTMGMGRAKAGVGITLRSPEQWRRRFFDYDYSEAELRHMIAHYDAELRRSDEEFGWLFERMREAGLMQRTVVVVTSDHGESFGEHGYLQHGARVDDPAMRVPLIVWLPPGHPAYDPGRVIDGLVRTVDILPTTLSALGAPIPAGLDGVDLLPAVAGDPLPRLWAYGETGKDFVGVDPDLHLRGIQGKHRMVRTAEWKLVRVPKPEADEYRLYDLVADPGELHDVAASHPDTVAELRGLLAEVLATEVERPDGAPVLTEQDRRLLEQLGYL